MENLGKSVAKSQSVENELILSLSTEPVMATKPSISTSFTYETLEETLDIKPQGAKLNIGIPKEIAFQENRIALTPDAVGVLVANGNQVAVEHKAGEASHFSDSDYSEAGARIVKPAQDTFYGGYGGYFQDLDGHVWEVVFNPGLDGLG